MNSMKILRVKIPPSIKSFSILKNGILGQKTAFNASYDVDHIPLLCNIDMGRDRIG